MSRSTIMFLDESGNHDLRATDPDYPIFVLGGVIVDREYAEIELTRRVNAFKRNVLGRDDVVLHTADITRNRNGFEALKDPGVRSRFYEQLNSLMLELEYKVVACAIRKSVLFERYGLDALDPYMLSLNVLVERFCFELEESGSQGFIVAEKRSPVLDRELDVAWLDLKIQGTRFLSAKTVNDRVTALVTRHKHENIAGLQLADLVVSPIGRNVLGKPSHEDWSIVASKFRRRFGRVEGAGLVVLPKE